MKSAPEEIENLRTQLRFIYNAYRTAALNRLYYGSRLVKYQRYNYGMEIAIGIGAAGSGGVAGLAIWGTLTGRYAWLSISGIAAVLGVLKPILQFAKSIENYTKLYAGYTNIYLELKSIVEEIEVARGIPQATLDRYRASRQLARELGGLDDPNPNRKLILRLEAEVNKMIPAETLWVPLGREK